MGKNTLNCLDIKAVLYKSGLLFFLVSILFLVKTIYCQNNYTIRSIKFAGNKYFSANEISAVVTLKKGSLFQPITLKSDLERIEDLYRNEGFLQIKIDSVLVDNDTSLLVVDITVFINEGKQSVIKELKFEGCENLQITDLRKVIQIKEGNVFVPNLLENDVQNILQLYEEKGYPLAKVVIKDVKFLDTADVNQISILIKIDEGRQIFISEIQIEGNKTTKDYVVLREARLRQNEIFRSYIPDKIKRRLEHLQLFSSVSLPELYLNENQKAGLLVRVTEGKFNRFDGVLGYVPAGNQQNRGYITGLVDVSFRNLFGTGRKLSARWYQENRSSRETEIHYLEPWIFSLPVNVQINFFQRKQDSTFVKMQYDFASEFMLNENFSIGASFTQTMVYPTEGYGRLVIPESRTTGFGLSVRYDSRDNPITPTSGILYFTDYKSGSKKINLSGAESKYSIRKLTFDLSYYFMLFTRQVIASELHIRDFNSDNMDMSDLFHLGGARTLRGYRENQFLGSRLVWANFEYRFLVAPRSFFYGFIDFGYISQPNIATIGMVAMEQNKIGYGIGVRMDSALGLIGVSFAMGEGDTFSTSKIHIRLINEF